MSEQESTPDVISFRTPQQKTITESMYKTMVNYLHCGNRAETLPLKTMYCKDDEERQELIDKMPMVYLFKAPTGFGKSAISLEPLRWLTTSITKQHDERFKTDPIIQALENIGADPDLIRLPNNVENRQELAEQLFTEYDPEQGLLPLGLGEGAIATVVRTRSQTQAFLREAERINAEAIALPSKASQCMTGAVQVSFSEKVDDMSYSGMPQPEESRIALSMVDDYDVPEVSDDFFNHSPEIIRLCSRCADSCSQCPMNLKVVKRNLESVENGKTLTGDAADIMHIHNLQGVPSESEYLRSVVEFQKEYKDLEDSTAAIKAKYPNLCAYPIIRDNLPQFNFIILTYPYIFNPNIRETMMDYLDHVKHLVIDEAHNIQSLFSSLSSNILLGENYYTKVNKALREYNHEAAVTAKSLQSQMRSQLFKKSEQMVQDFLKDFYSSKGIYKEELKSFHVKHGALAEACDSGLLDKGMVVEIYEEVEPVINYFTAYFAMVQTKYVEFWERIVAKHYNENDIANGFEPEAVEIINILFGDYEGYVKNYYRDDEDNLFHIIERAHSGSLDHHLGEMGNVNTLIKRMRELEQWRRSQFIDRARYFNDGEVRQIMRNIYDVVEAIYNKAQDILCLSGVLINNFPTEMANWKLHQNISNDDFKWMFLSQTIGLMSAEERKTFQDWYLNGSIDYDQLYFLASRRGMDMDRHDSMDLYNVSKELVDIFDAELEPNKAKMQHFVEVWDEAFPERKLEDIPMLQYTGKFPTYMWKLYYRYWDDTMQIIPLTLGRLLTTAFERYDTVGLLSGTFQELDYIRTFWGINPYDFEVTETVGTKKVVYVKGMSTKYSERESGYPKYAQLAKRVFEEGCQKNLMLAVPSNDYLKNVLPYLEELVPADDIWPNSRLLEGEDAALQVNDMIEAIQEASWQEKKKIFVVVMGSRFTEGVEYVDPVTKESMLDNIILAGIPYPAPDIFNADQQQYAAEQLRLEQRDAFDLIQTHAAFQKVRQTVGRGIRSNKDSVVVYLADNRYDSTFWQNHIPVDEYFVI